MIRRVFNAWVVECAKASRNSSTFVGPVLVLLVIGVTFIMQPVARDGESDYGFVSFAAPLAINVPGFLLILVYSAGLVSGELASGTLRTMLVQAVRRREVLLAKFLLGLTYALVLDLLVAGGCWFGTSLLGELSGIRFGGELLYTDMEMAIAFGLALLFVFVAQSAVVAWGLFCSTCTRSGTAAVSIAVGGWLACEAAKYPLGIEPWVLFTWLEWPWQVFADRCDAIATAWFPAAGQALAVSGVTTVVFLLLAVVIMARRDMST